MTAYWLVGLAALVALGWLLGWRLGKIPPKPTPPAPARLCLRCWLQAHPKYGAWDAVKDDSLPVRMCVRCGIARGMYPTGGRA